MFFQLEIWTRNDDPENYLLADKLQKKVTPSKNIQKLFSFRECLLWMCAHLICHRISSLVSRRLVLTRIPVAVDVVGAVAGAHLLPWKYLRAFISKDTNVAPPICGEKATFGEVLTTTSSLSGNEWDFFCCGNWKNRSDFWL